VKVVPFFGEERAEMLLEVLGSKTIGMSLNQTWTKSVLDLFEPADCLNE
jgi:hypothetical protein